MGALAGFKVVEFSGIGPGPMAGMLLADMGATVLRIERPVPSGLGLDRPSRLNFLNRGKRSVVLDLKAKEGVALALELVSRADGLIEGFRPGTMERLGLGPDQCLQVNPRLVYGRITGWGQSGPLALAAGHDMNYVALSGALDSMGREGQPPAVPLNLIGDYGGASYLVMGILAALLNSGRTGKGQVVDAAMVEAATSLMTSTYGLKAAGMHDGARGTNLLDTGAPFYDVYQCADGKWVSIAPIELKFRVQLFKLIGLDSSWVERSNRREEWPAVRSALAGCFCKRTRDEWSSLLEGTDACFAPILSMAEAPSHPHLLEREAFITIEGISQPAPAPRFSRTSATLPTPPEAPGETADEAMREWGFGARQVAAYRQQGALVARADRPTDSSLSPGGIA